MAGRIPENLLEDILGRVDIVELISSYIPLKKAGRNFKANCPFHHEKTPSFMVSPDRQIYHCFGCGESGNAFKFLMRHERMDFPEAVELLARKAGVELPRRESQEASRDASLSTQLYKINELAVSFYESNLKAEAASATREYLAKRGIRPQTAKEFHLGYALAGWDHLLNFLRSKNAGLGLIEKAGLILPKDGGGYYDRFRNRVIFPIFDIRMRAVGFGARVLDKSLPKYVNSPETPVYIKGRNLFGLNLSKDHIRDADSAIIVEGYLDFIMPYQEGIKNIVASQGTALTTEQIKLLKRYTTNAVMVYDGDTAGQAATLRSLELLIEEGMNVRIVPLPKGLDPDALVRLKGAAVFKSMIDKATGLFDYKLGVLKLAHDIKEAYGKSRIASEMLSTIRKFDNAILRAEYAKRLSEELKTPESCIIEELNKLKPLSKGREEAPSAFKASVPLINPAEKMLIKFMLEEKEFIERIMQELEPADFQDMRTAKVISALCELFSQGKSFSASLLLNYLSEEETGQLLCESVFMPELSQEEKERAFNDCIRRVKIERLKSKRENLHLQIKNAQKLGDEERLSKLIREFHELIRKGD